jgi:hypothetical protein
VKFQKWGEGTFVFLLVSFNDFYFNTLKFQSFLIFFLSFWGSLTFLCEVSQGGKGVFVFLLVNFNGFLF